MSRAEVTSWDALEEARQWAAERGLPRIAAGWSGLHLLLTQPPQTQAQQGFARCGHGDRHPRLVPLARAMAVLFQAPEPTTEQIGWFMEDANDVIDDFPADTTEWTVTAVPDGQKAYPDEDAVAGPNPDPMPEEFVSQFFVNGEHYVVPDGEGFVTAQSLASWRRNDLDVEDAGLYGDTP